MDAHLLRILALLDSAREGLITPPYLQTEDIWGGELFLDVKGMRSPQPKINIYSFFILCIDLFLKESSQPVQSRSIIRAKAL